VSSAVGRPLSTGTVRLTGQGRKEWNVAVRRQDLIVVVTSVGTEDQALDIAHALVRNRQAACVNLIPNVHSIYRWKGRVCDDGEFLLLIKTRAREFESVRQTIQKINTYELPEVLAYRVDEASPGFAAWIEKMTEHPKKKLSVARKPPALRRRAVG
jgi:periplasmic divalent cation tolerance protein